MKSLYSMSFLVLNIHLKIYLYHLLFFTNYDKIQQRSTTNSTKSNEKG